MKTVSDIHITQEGAFRSGFVELFFKTLKKVRTCFNNCPTNLEVIPKTGYSFLRAFIYLPHFMSQKLTADDIMNEVLVMTVIQKEWDYKRIADFAIDKQIALLNAILEQIEHPAVREKLNELLAASEEVAKLSSQ